LRVERREWQKAEMKDALRVKSIEKRCDGMMGNKR
jgi:hypothetical protein